MIGDKAFQRACETRLKEYVIKRFGRDDAVKNSENTPDAKSYYSIKKRYLLKDITDKVFHDYAEAKWTDDYIQMYDFVDFIINKGNTNSTRGKYQEYMDYVMAYYDVEIINYALDFDNVCETIIKHIIPKREEYMAVWSIINMIREDPFLKKYKNDYLKTTYQQCVNKGDNRFYDLLFEEIGVIIEVQEYSFAHTQNFNDVLEEALVIARNKRIYYFKMGDYKENQYMYLRTTLEKIREMLIQAVLAKDESIRKDYVFDMFENDVKKDIDKNQQMIKYIKIQPYNKKEKKLMIQGLNNRITYLNTLSADDKDNKIIQKIFQWKSIAEKSYDKYVITIDDIAYILSIKNVDKKEKLTHEIYNEGNFIIKHHKVYLDWKGMVEVVIKTDRCDNILKTIILSYLTRVEEYYEYIVQGVQKHYQACLLASSQMIDIVNDHMKEKLSDQYQNKIDTQQEEINILTEENANVVRKINIVNKRSNQLYKSLKSKVSNKKEKSLIKEWKTKMKELDEIYKKNKLKALTIQKKVNMSIFKELPDFPIIYNGFEMGRIPTDIFDAICKEWDIPKSVVNRSYGSLCLMFTNIRPNNIPFVGIRADMCDRYWGEYNPTYNSNKISFSNDEEKSESNEETTDILSISDSDNTFIGQAEKDDF